VFYFLSFCFCVFHLLCLCAFICISLCRYLCLCPYVHLALSPGSARTVLQLKAPGECHCCCHVCDAAISGYQGRPSPWGNDAFPLCFKFPLFPKKNSDSVENFPNCAFSPLLSIDSMGLHRVENPSHSDRAVSLHVYSPPFDKCNLFDVRTGQKRSTRMTFWSRDGKLELSEPVSLAYSVLVSVHVRFAKLYRRR